MQQIRACLNVSITHYLLPNKTCPFLIKHNNYLSYLVTWICARQYVEEVMVSEKHRIWAVTAMTHCNCDSTEFMLKFPEMLFVESNYCQLTWVLWEQSINFQPPAARGMAPFRTIPPRKSWNLLRNALWWFCLDLTDAFGIKLLHEPMLT